VSNKFVRKAIGNLHCPLTGAMQLSNPNKAKNQKNKSKRPTLTPDDKNITTNIQPVIFLSKVLKNATAQHFYQNKIKKGGKQNHGNRT
jgi:hypothetical protein